MRNFFDKFFADRYYKMTDKELELEANKYNIGEYFDGSRILRQSIIKQLLDKDIANNSKVAIVVSLFALLISIISIITKIEIKINL